ncbi:MAG: lipase family protein [Actinomycetota bacterium]|nr:lipase family protein [Actinomycetota bacterium]
MNVSRRCVGTVTALCVGTSALGMTALAPSAQAEVSGGVTIPAFYNPPATLPTANGTIIRSESVTLGVGLNIPGIVGPLPATATRIMYKSTDFAGKPVAVTGTYLEPSTRWTGGGPRPLVTFAEGTQGQGDQCAPSISLTRPLTVTSSTLNVNYEIPNIYGLLNKGVAVVVSDLVGLGTTDRVHSYVNRLDSGHAVLDAARAARQVRGASVTMQSRVATYGYSQGGEASAAAAELAPTYAPDLNLVAGYAGAPPADLTKVLPGIDGTALTGAIGYAINGFTADYPALKSVIDANVNATGRAALAKVATQCTVDTALSFGFAKTSSWTNSGQSISAIVAANPAAQAVINAQQIGKLTPTVPMRIASGTQDDIVNHAQVRQLALDWCRKGAKVQYVPVPQLLPSGGTALNHIGPALADALPAQSWIVSALSGQQVPTTGCGWIPWMA